MRNISTFILLALAGLVIAGCGSGLFKSGPHSSTSNYGSPASDSVTGVLRSYNPKTKPYTVFGVRYYPLKTARGYDEIGIASWYGKDFHGKLTASGDVYDMYQMTAAHKTLPLGTIVDVTNLSNGRRVKLLVNDRGPFVGARIIDLSYGAAQALGTAADGLAKVRVTTVGTAGETPATMVARRATSRPATPTRSANQQRATTPRRTAPRTVAQAPTTFGIQVGAYRDLGYADRVKRHLMYKGFSGAHVSRVQRYNEQIYVVMAGAYPSELLARQALHHVRQFYPMSIIRT